MAIPTPGIVGPEGNAGVGGTASMAADASTSVWRDQPPLQPDAGPAAPGKMNILAGTDGGAVTTIVDAGAFSGSAGGGGSAGTGVKTEIGDGGGADTMNGASRGPEVH